MALAKTLVVALAFAYLAIAALLWVMQERLMFLSARASVALTTPFDSALEVAAKMYPWLPISWLLRHPFDSAALAPRIRIPALILIAEADNVIPKRHSERLAERWGGPVERRYFQGFGHNDLDLHPVYAAAVRDF